MVSRDLSRRNQTMLFGRRFAMRMGGSMDMAYKLSSLAVTASTYGSELQSNITTQIYKLRIQHSIC